MARQQARAGDPTRAASRGPVLDLLAAAALWGGMYVVSAGTFDAIPPLTLGVLRLVIGVAVLVAVFRGRLGLAAAMLGDDKKDALPAKTRATLEPRFRANFAGGGLERSARAGDRRRRHRREPRQ